MPTIQASQQSSTVSMDIQDLPLASVPEGEIGFNPYQFPEIVTYDSAGPGRVPVYQQEVGENGESLGFVRRYVEEKDLTTIIPSSGVPSLQPSESPRVGVYEQMQTRDRFIPSLRERGETSLLSDHTRLLRDRENEKVGAYVTQHPYSNERLEMLKAMINPPRR
ncbi:MAG: hypothetical protein U1F66_05670 [bacterium]